MPKIRVLVVDDAVVFRRLVSEEIARDPGLEVVATAANGRIALARMTQVNPDVVILDIEMPEMDGLTALKELRKTHPRTPVIMFSSLTSRGAEATLDALSFGASDYFTKPSNAGSLDASLQVIREQLVPKIKALCARSENGTQATSRVTTATAPAAPSARGLPPVSRSAGGPVHALAIGASTGGPNALAEILHRLPADFPVPILLVQHMPPMFTRLLAERLSAKGAIPVQEAKSGDQLKPGMASIAPGDYHMTVARDGLQVHTLLNQEPPENSCRPAVDVLFRSVAKTYGSNTLGVILTGMGQDGLRGCEFIRAAAGQILAQDEATSVVWGMPGYVARAGLADRVMPLSLIADEILRRVRQTRRQSDVGGFMTEQDFDVIRKLLHERSAIVLDSSKQYLVESRLAPVLRRLNLDSISDLIARLRGKSGNGLYRQIVEAMVTTESSFFRDHIPFEALRKVVIPNLIELRRAERSLQIWCAASSHGQEPYSIAILLREHFPELAAWKISLLATDLSREVLARAREGRYNQVEAKRGLSVALLAKYFEQQGTDWQLKPAIRQMVDFQEINLAQPWPALPRMDLVLIRNVMIYFDVETKKTILGRLARLLRPDGYVILGGAETTINLDSSYRRVEPLKAGLFQVIT